MWSGMTLDVSLLIRLITKERIFVPAGVNEQNVAVLHIRTILDIFGREETHIIQHVTQVHDYTRTIAPLNRDLVNRLAFRYKMPRRVKMCTHMVRSLNVLRSEEHTSELQSQSNLVCRL